MKNRGTCSTPNSVITLTQISGVASYEALGHMQHPNSAITLTQISGVDSYEALGHMQHPQQCYYTYSNQWRRQL